MDKYNFLQVYTPPHRNTIAIEPMTCLADAFNNKKGLIILKPSETASFSFGVKLE
jgi:aldose 1-epimerase